MQRRRMRSIVRVQGAEETGLGMLSNVHTQQRPRAVTHRRNSEPSAASPPSIRYMSVNVSRAPNWPSK